MNRHSDAFLAKQRASTKRASLWGVTSDARRNAQPQRWRSDIEHSYWRAECMQHFWPFFLYAWGVAHGPHARSWWIDRAEVGEPLAHWFEHQAREWFAARARHEKVIRHIMVIVTREFGKTTLISQAGLAWLHLQDPNLSTYIGGEKAEVVTDVLKGIRSVLDGSDAHAKFVSLYGDWLGSQGIVRKDSIVHCARSNTTRKEPSFGIWGVESGLTGKHPDVLCLDDPNTYERKATQENWYEVVNSHVASLAPVILADGLFILVGTPYSDADHLNQTLRRDGIATLTGLPMHDHEPRADGIWHVFHLPGRDPHNRPTVPNVWSESRMAKFERENTERYSAQVLLRPELSEHNPLTLEQIRDCLCDERNIPMNLLRYSIHFDTAFREEDKQHRGDESVFVVWGHYRDGSGDVVFVEGYSSGIWRGEDFYLAVVKLLQRYRRAGRRIAIMTDERSAGKEGASRMLLESFCHGAGIARPGEWLEIPRGGKKKLEHRIRPAASYWADGHVKLIRTAPGLDKLIHQMSRIGRSVHDDWADASADVFHPQVYSRQRKLALAADAQPPWLSSPQDIILKNVARSDELRELYDRWRNRDDEVPYEPV